MTREQKAKKAAERDVLAAIAKASTQYDAYVQLANLQDLSKLSSEETWQHDPNTPLSLELKK